MIPSMKCKNPPFNDMLTNFKLYFGVVFVFINVCKTYVYHNKSLS